MALRGSTGGLLAVHAHPDDETLSTGGLLAAWARSGRPVTLVTCTRGEQGDVIPAELAYLEGDARALGAHREHELADALRALGVTDHHFLDQLADPTAPGGAHGPASPAVAYCDSGMVWEPAGRAGRVAELPEAAFVAVPVDDAARRLVALIRARRPDVVVTYEPGGGYGHPDHVHAHRVTMRAVELAASEGTRVAPGPGGAVGALPPFRVPLVLWAAQPEETIRSALLALPHLSWVEALRQADPRLVVRDPTGPLLSIAVPHSQLDYVVDTSGVGSDVVDALRSHLTQVHAIGVASPAPVVGAAITGCFALSNHVVLPLYDREWYRVATTWRPGAVANLLPLTPQVS